MGKQRTAAEVLEAQSHAQMGGCCDRFAEQSPCDCLEQARQLEQTPGHPTTVDCPVRFCLASKGRPCGTIDGRPMLNTWHEMRHQAAAVSSGAEPFDLGRFLEWTPRTDAVQKAVGELGQFLVGWAKRHGLTRAEYLMLLGREVVSDLERAVATERKS